MPKNKNYLKFEKADGNVYFVSNKRTNEYLGEISVHRPWKKYIFAPSDDTFFCQMCMSEITDFLNSLNNAGERKA